MQRLQIPRVAALLAVVACTLVLVSGEIPAVAAGNGGSLKVSLGDGHRQLLQATPGTTQTTPGSAGTVASPPPPSAVIFQPTTSVVLPRAPSPAPSQPPPPPPPPPRVAPAPAPAPTVGSPRPANGSATPAPAPALGSPAPAPVPSAQTPAPAPVSSAPAPVPAQGTPAPAPSLQSATLAPAPAALLNGSAPAPSPSAPALVLPLTATPRPDATGFPAPAPVPASSQAFGTVPAPAPVPAGALITAPVPVPAPEPATIPVPAPAPVSAPVPAPAPVLPPAVSPANAPSPGGATLPSFLGDQQTVAPADALSPPSVAPAGAPVAPAPAPLASGLNPAQAPQPATSPGPATAPGAAGVNGTGPAPSPGSLSPLQAPAPSLLSPGLAPALSPALSQVYPASALAPAPPGQASTLVTLPTAAIAGSNNITRVDPNTGVASLATPETISNGGQLFSRPGTISLIVQTSAPTSDLPASAVSAQGGTVTSTSPVQGSGGRLFNVNLATASGASFLAVSTLAGVGLANGLTTTASNTVRIQLDNTNPTTTITSGSGYNNGRSVTPSFTIDFGGQVRQTNPQLLYTLTGVTRTDVLYDYGNGRIFIQAYILPDQENQPFNIVVSVAAGVTTDLAGNPNTAATYTYAFQPANPSYTTVSTVANAVTGASLGVAVAAPLALGALSTGVAGGAAAAAGTFYLLHILQGLQYTYLAGRMNVANLPPNFRQVSDSFSWTVLNFRAPWQTARSNTVSAERANSGFPSTPQGISTPSFGPSGSSNSFFSVSGRRLLAEETHARKLHQFAPALAPLGARNGTVVVPNVAGGSSEYVVTSTGLNRTNETSATSAASVTDLSTQVSNAALGNGDDPYETVWRSLFWLGLGVIAISLLVYLAHVLCTYRRWDVPIILTSPRPQIMLLMFGVTAIAQASAGLFAGGDGKAIAVGVVIVCLLPFMMVLYAAWFVWRHILPHEGRRAAWVLAEDPETAEPERPTWWGKILDVVVGPKGKEGMWMALKRRDSRFVTKYGPLFEVNQGPPMVLTDVTYEVDPATGFCNRGRLQPAYEAPIFKLGRFKIYPYHLQGQNSGLELLMGIGTAILLQAFTEPNSYAQVITLIALNVLLLLWLRLIRPVGDRTELIMAMIGCLSTMGVYICGLILLANPNGSDAFRNRIGIAMIVLGLWSAVTFILGLLAFIMTAFSLWKEARNWLFPSRDPARKFANVVYAVMEKDERILARKFADRWLYKALGSGLHGRALSRKEQRKRDAQNKFYGAVLLANQRGKTSKRPPRVGPATAGSGSLSGAPSANGGVPHGLAAWPGMQQLSGLKKADSSKALLDTASLPNTPVINGGDARADDFLERQKAKTHPAAPQTIAASPLATRNPQGERENNSLAGNRDPTAPPSPHVAVDFETGVAEAQSPASPVHRRIPSRSSPSPPRRGFRDASNKENQ